jgi:hypothetical protein
MTEMVIILFYDSFMPSAEKPIPAGNEKPLDTEKAKLFTSLEAIFSMIQKQADRKHIPPNRNPQNISFALEILRETRQYIFRINPALVDNGKLSVASLNLYEVRIDNAGKDGDGGIARRTTHIQEWIVRASWIDGKPKITDEDIDAIVIETDGNIIGLPAVAERARDILQIRTGIQDNLAQTHGILIPQPPGIN